MSLAHELCDPHTLAIEVARTDRSYSVWWWYGRPDGGPADAALTTAQRASLTYLREMPGVTPAELMIALEHRRTYLSCCACREALFVCAADYHTALLTSNRPHACLADASRA